MRTLRHTRPPRTIAALGAAALLALSACGGDDDADTADDPPPADPADTASDPQPTDPADTDSDDGDEIVISGSSFSGVTEVDVGTTVTVVNNDSLPHTWTATDGTFDSGGLSPGDSFEFTFDEPGTYEFRCNIHPTMTGTITVT